MIQTELINPRGLRQKLDSCIILPISFAMEYFYDQTPEQTISDFIEYKRNNKISYDRFECAEQGFWHNSYCVVPPLDVNHLMIAAFINEWINRDRNLIAVKRIDLVASMQEAEDALRSSETILSTALHQRCDGRNVWTHVVPITCNRDFLLHETRTGINVATWVLGSSIANLLNSPYPASGADLPLEFGDALIISRQ